MLRSCFARTEPWLQAGKYAAAVMCDLRRRNGWTIAERAGDRTPDRTQRLLNRAVWDTWAAMGVVRRFAVAGLDEAARKTGRRRGLAVGAVDETGQVAHQRGGVLARLQPRLHPHKARPQQPQQLSALPPAQPGTYPGGSSRLRSCCLHKRIIARRLRYAKAYDALSTRSDPQWLLPY